nr:uncharacterized protein LOC106683229 isoform X2 [Halyomorpha halys]
MDSSISKGSYPEEEYDLNLQHNTNNGNAGQSEDITIAIEKAIEGMKEKQRGLSKLGAANYDSENVDQEECDVIYEENRDNKQSGCSSNVGAANYESESVDQEECHNFIYDENRDTGINVCTLSKPVSAAHTDHQYAAAPAEEICLGNEISVNVCDSYVSTEELLDDLENQEQFEHLSISSLDDRKLSYDSSCFNNIRQNDFIEELPSSDKYTSIQNLKEGKTFLKQFTNSSKNNKGNRVWTTHSPIVYVANLSESKNSSELNPLNSFYESFGTNLANDKNEEPEMPKLVNETEAIVIPSEHDQPPELTPQNIVVSEQVIGVVHPFNHENNVNIYNPINNVLGVSSLSDKRKPLNQPTDVITRNRLRSRCLDSVIYTPRSMIKKQGSYRTVILKHDSLKTTATINKEINMWKGISSGNHYRVAQGIKHVSSEDEIELKIPNGQPIMPDSIKNTVCDDQETMKNNKSNSCYSPVCSVKTDKILVSERKLETLPSMPILLSPTREETQSPVLQCNKGETSKKPNSKNKTSKRIPTRSTATPLRSFQRLSFKELSSSPQLNSNKNPILKTTENSKHETILSGSITNDNTIFPVKHDINNIIKTIGLEEYESHSEIDLNARITHFSVSKNEEITKSTVKDDLNKKHHNNIIVKDIHSPDLISSTLETLTIETKETDSSLETNDDLLIDLGLDQVQTNPLDESVPSLDPYIIEIQPTADMLEVIPAADILDGGITDIYFTIPETKFEEEKIILEKVNSLNDEKSSLVDMNESTDNKEEVGSKTKRKEFGCLISISDIDNHDKRKSEVIKVEPFTIAPKQKEYDDSKNNLISEIEKINQVLDRELANVVGDKIISGSCSEDLSLPSFSSSIRKENQNLNETSTTETVFEKKLQEDTIHEMSKLSEDCVSASIEITVNPSDNQHSCKEVDVLKTEERNDNPDKYQVDGNFSTNQKNIQDTDGNTIAASMSDKKQKLETSNKEDNRDEYLEDISDGDFEIDDDSKLPTRNNFTTGRNAPTNCKNTYHKIRTNNANSSKKHGNQKVSLQREVTKYHGGSNFRFSKDSSSFNMSSSAYKNNTCTNTSYRKRTRASKSHQGNNASSLKKGKEGPISQAAKKRDTCKRFGPTKMSSASDEFNIIPNGRASAPKIGGNDLPCRKHKINTQDNICKRMQEDKASYSKIKNKDLSQLEKFDLRNYSPGISFPSSKSNTVKINRNNDNTIVSLKLKDEIEFSPEESKECINVKQAVKSPQHNKKKVGLEDIIKKIKSDKNVSEEYIDKWRVGENTMNSFVLKSNESDVSKSENSDSTLSSDSKIETEIIHDNLDDQLDLITNKMCSSESKFNEKDLDLVKTNGGFNESHVLNEIEAQKLNECAVFNSNEKVNPESNPCENENKIKNDLSSVSKNSFMKEKKSFLESINKSSPLLKQTCDNNVVSEIKVNISCQKADINSHANQLVLTNELSQNQDKLIVPDAMKEKNHDAAAATESCGKRERNDNINLTPKQISETGNIFNPSDGASSKKDQDLSLLNNHSDKVPKPIESINDENILQTSTTNVQVTNEVEIDKNISVVELVYSQKINQGDSESNSVTKNIHKNEASDHVESPLLDLNNASSINETCKLESYENISIENVENADKPLTDNGNCIDVTSSTGQMMHVTEITQNNDSQETENGTNVNDRTDSPCIESVTGIADNSQCSENVPTDVENCSSNTAEKTSCPSHTENVPTDDVSDVNVTDENGINVAKKTESPSSIENVPTDDANDVNDTDKTDTLSSIENVLTDDVCDVHVTYETDTSSNTEKVPTDDIYDVNVTDKTDTTSCAENIPTDDKSGTNLTNKTDSPSCIENVPTEDASGVNVTVETDPPSCIENVLIDDICDNVNDKTDTTSCVENVSTDSENGTNVNDKTESPCIENVLTDDICDVNVTDETDRPSCIENVQADDENGTNVTEKTDRPSCIENILTYDASGVNVTDEIDTTSCVENVPTDGENGTNVTEKTDIPSCVVYIPTDNTIGINVTDETESSCIENVPTDDENGTKVNEKTDSSSCKEKLPIDNGSGIDGSHETDSPSCIENVPTYDSNSKEKTFTKKLQSIEDVSGHTNATAFSETTNQIINFTETNNQINNVIETSESTEKLQPYITESFNLQVNNTEIDIIVPEKAIQIIDVIEPTKTTDNTIFIEPVIPTVSDEYSINDSKKTFTRKLESVSNGENNMNVPKAAESSEKPLSIENCINVTDKTFNETDYKQQHGEKVNSTDSSNESCINANETTFTENTAEPQDLDNVNQTVTDDKNNVSDTEKTLNENADETLSIKCINQTVSDGENSTNINENSLVLENYNQTVTEVTNNTFSENSDETLDIKNVYNDGSSINTTDKSQSQETVSCTIAADDDVINVTEANLRNNLKQSLFLDPHPSENNVKRKKSSDLAISELRKSEESKENENSKELVNSQICDPESVKGGVNSQSSLALADLITETSNPENSKIFSSAIESAYSVGIKSTDEEKVKEKPAADTLVDYLSSPSITDRNETNSPTELNNLKSSDFVSNSSSKVSRTNPLKDHIETIDSTKMLNESEMVICDSADSRSKFNNDNTNEENERDSVCTNEAKTDAVCMNSIEHNSVEISIEKSSQNQAEFNKIEKVIKESHIDHNIIITNQQEPVSENLQNNSLSPPLLSSEASVSDKPSKNRGNGPESKIQCENSVESVNHKLNSEAILPLQGLVEVKVPLLISDDSTEHVDRSVKSTNFSEFTKIMTSSEKVDPKGNNEPEKFIQEFTRYIGPNNRLQSEIVDRWVENPSSMELNENSISNSDQSSVVITSSDSPESFDQGNKLEEAPHVNLKTDMYSPKQKRFPSPQGPAIDNSKLLVRATDSNLSNSVDVKPNEFSERYNNEVDQLPLVDCRESEVVTNSSDFAVGNDKPKEYSTLSSPVSENSVPSENQPNISVDTTDNQVSSQSETINNPIIEPLSESTELENSYFDNVSSNKQLSTDSSKLVSDTKTEESATVYSDYSSPDALDEQKEDVHSNSNNPCEQENIVTGNSEQFFSKNHCTVSSIKREEQLESEVTEQSLGFLEHRSLISGSNNLGLDPENNTKPDTSETVNLKSSEVSIPTSTSEDHAVAKLLPVNSDSELNSSEVSVPISTSEDHNVAKLLPVNSDSELNSSEGSVPISTNEDHAVTKLVPVHSDSALNNFNSERLPLPHLSTVKNRKQSVLSANSNLSNSTEENIQNSRISEDSCKSDIKQLPEKIPESEVTYSVETSPQSNSTCLSDCPEPNSGNAENNKKSKSEQMKNKNLSQVNDSDGKQEESTSNVIVANFIQSSISVKPRDSKILLLKKSDLNECQDLSDKRALCKEKENNVSISKDQNNEIENKKLKLNKQDEIVHNDMEIVETNRVCSVLSKATNTELIKKCVKKEIRIILEKIDTSDIFCANVETSNHKRKRQICGQSGSVKRTSNSLFHQEEPPRKILLVDPPKKVVDDCLVNENKMIQERPNLRSKSTVSRKGKTKVNTSGNHRKGKTEVNSGENLCPVSVLLSRLDSFSSIRECMGNNKVKRVFIPSNSYNCLKKDTCQPSVYSDLEIICTKTTERNSRFKRRRRKSTDDESDNENHLSKDQLERPRSNKRTKQDKGLSSDKSHSNFNNSSLLTSKNYQSTKVKSLSESLSIHEKTVSSSISFKRHHESEISNEALPKRPNLDNNGSCSSYRPETVKYLSMEKPIAGRPIEAEVPVDSCSTGHRGVLKVERTMKELLHDVVWKRLNQAAETSEDEEDSDDDFMGFEDQLPCGCSLGSNSISPSCTGNCFIRRVKFKLSYLNRTVKPSSTHSSTRSNERFRTFRPSICYVSLGVRSPKSEGSFTSYSELVPSKNVKVTDNRIQLARILVTRPSSVIETDMSHKEDSGSSS